ncbi:hypothetical protein Tco_0616420, partial [Tanacetum coccineum]
MLKVAKLSQEPELSLILSSEKVNADDTADKSSSRTFVQPVTQPKAPTDLKSKKKKILPSSKPKSSYKVRVILPKTQSLRLNMLRKQWPPLMPPREEVKESGLESMEDVTFDQIMDEIDQYNKTAEKPESPFDTDQFTWYPIKGSKKTLPQLIKDSIKQFVSESIEDKLLLFDAQVHQSLQDQLPNILLKPINREFNAFKTLESR